MSILVMVGLSGLAAACDSPANSESAGGASGTTGGATAAGGTTGVGGQTSPSLGGSTTLSTSEEGFVLAWEDNFDSIDSSLWALQTFSWDGNLAQFSTANAEAVNGVVTIHLTREPGDATKPFRGVEMRSRKTITYGKIEARIRFAKGSGVVSGLVAIYTPWPADDWNEIDFEHLGNAATSLQTNCQVYTGPAVQKPVTTSVTPSRYEQIVSLGFDAEADFHIYSAEWTPTDVKFLVDGQVVRTWSDEIARMRLPQNILFTIWASDSAAWAGAIDDTTAPSSAEMDWIKVYELR